MARLGMAIWFVIVMSVAACMPVMPEDSATPATEATTQPTEEAMEEPTSAPTEEPGEEPGEEATAAPTEEAGGAGADAAGLEVASQLQQNLASELQLDVDQVEVVSVEAVEWPDACLGVYSPEVMCAQVITPGYLVILAVDGQQYEYHTNSDGSSVQVAAAPDTGIDQEELGEGVVFVWYREGGIAGFCDILTAYITGELEAATCFSDPPQVVATRQMTAEESAQLRTWMADFASFDYLHDDGNVDDGMIVRLRFAGEGSTIPDGVQQDEIVATVQEWHAAIAQ